MKTLSDWTADPDVARRAQNILSHAFGSLRACDGWVRRTYHLDSYVAWEPADKADNDLTYDLYEDHRLWVSFVVPGKDDTVIAGDRVSLHYLELTVEGSQLLNELIDVLYPELRQR